MKCMIYKKICTSIPLRYKFEGLKYVYRKELNSNKRTCDECGLKLRKTPKRLYCDTIHS